MGMTKQVFPDYTPHYLLRLTRDDPMTTRQLFGLPIMGIPIPGLLVITLLIELDPAQSHGFGAFEVKTMPWIAVLSIGIWLGTDSTG
jgi:hypothetical protein